MNDRLRQLKRPRPNTETAGRYNKISGCHTKGYACLMSEKMRIHHRDISVQKRPQVCALHIVTRGPNGPVNAHLIYGPTISTKTSFAKFVIAVKEVRVNLVIYDHLYKLVALV